MAAPSQDTSLKTPDGYDVPIARYGRLNRSYYDEISEEQIPYHHIYRAVSVKTLAIGENVDLLWLRPNDEMSNTSTGLTATVLTDSSPPWYGQDLTVDASSGDKTFTVASVSGVKKGMRIMVKETGKDTTIGYVVDYSSPANTITINHPLLEDYTVAGGAYAVRDLIDRLLIPNTSNPSALFEITDNDKTTITVSGDMTAVASIGDTYKVCKEVFFIKEIELTTEANVKFTASLSTHETRNLEVEGGVLIVGTVFNHTYVFAIHLNGATDDFFKIKVHDFQNNAPEVSANTSFWMESEA